MKFIHAAVAAVVMAMPLRAQSLADRVAAVRDGAVNFHFAARPGVCGDGEHFVRTGRGSYQGEFSGEYRGAPCDEGPVQVRLVIRDGTIVRVQSWVGRLHVRDGSDLGVVPATDAARYLLNVAQRASGSASARAIFPAVLADSATVWPTLLAIAHDEDRASSGTRQEVMLWLSRFASGAVAGHPNDPFYDDDSDDPDEDLKSHAVFVLSQLPNGEGVSSLLEVARTNRSAHVRGQALFWLGQSGDSRALALFETLLRS
jgi:hypothetical protein